MTGLFIYTIAAFGFAYIVGHSLISKPVREWIAGEVDETGAPKGGLRFAVISLVECPACLGFWIGFAVASASPEAITNVPPYALGCYTAGANFILGRTTGLMQ